MAEAEDMTKTLDEKVEKRQQKTDVKYDTKPIDNNLTISTKLSTDQLICKTPQESPSISVNSLKVDEIRNQEGKKYKWNSVLYLGIFQILFGFLMAVFGILVIVHRASLSQFGAGIWGGCLAIATGIAGIISAAKTLCPLNSTAQTVTHTVFLALSLISLAISQLVVVIAATGLARDVNTLNAEESEENEKTQGLEKVSLNPLLTYQSLLANIGLLLVSAIECICAAVSSYKSARDICPCFKRGDENFKELNLNHSHAIVNSWLGKQNSPAPSPQFYIVAAPGSSLGKVSRMSRAPVFTIPQPMMQPQIIGYPLIPAPLGTIPSPIIPPSHRVPTVYRIPKGRKPKSRRPSQPVKQKPSSRSQSKREERQISESDVARTYTGLDRAIAENFIDILDSKNNSLCSDFSSTVTSSSSCQSPSKTSSSSGDISQDYLVNKM